MCQFILIEIINDAHALDFYINFQKLGSSNLNSNYNKIETNTALLKCFLISLQYLNLDFTLLKIMMRPFYCVFI